MNEPERMACRGIDGYVYVSGNGQLVVDRHPSDHEHLIAKSERKTQPIHDCRVYLKDLIPDEWVGERGKLDVTRVFDCFGKVAAVQLVFTPDALLG
jgi:hypothetical protein